MSTGPALGVLARRPGRALGVGPLLPAVLSGVGSVACGIGLLATSGWLITRAAERPPVFELSVAIGAVQAFALGRGVARYLQRLWMHGASLDLLGRLRLALFDAVEPQVPGGPPGLSSGAVVSGFVADAEVVTEGFAKVVGAATDVLASIAIGTLVAALVDPRLGAVLLSGACAVIVVALATARLGRAGARDEAALRQELAAEVTDMARAAPELVAFGRADLVSAALEDVRRRSVAAAWRRSVAAGLGRAGVILAGVGTVLAVVAAGLDAHDAGRVSGVTLAVAVFASLAVVDQLAVLPAVLADAGSARQAAAALRPLSELDPPAPEPDRPAPPVGPGAGAELDHVVVDAGPARLLDGVSLTLQPGRRLALTGASGSGKSTVLHALVRFVGCTGGRASIGGTDVATMARGDIARRAAWMGDETHVFAATLADNLRLARPTAGDDECVDVLARAGLGPWFAALPGGLGTGLGAGGRPMSAGERQRLGVARALLGGGDVLLLDEPTAHVDPSSSGAVLEELLDAAAGRAVLVVSHEPDIARHVDEVTVLDGGRLVS